MPCKVPWKTSTASNRSVDAMPSQTIRCMGTQARLWEAPLTERRELWLSRDPGYRKQDYQCYRILANAEHQRRDYGALRCQETRRETRRTGSMILPANQSWAWGSDQGNAALGHSEIQLKFAYGVYEGLQGSDAAQTLALGQSTPRTLTTGSRRCG